MSLIKMYFKELSAESITTRKMLERVPTELFGWQPHEKSMTVKRLATHLAELPGWISMAISTDELDFSNNMYQPKELNTSEELLDYFEESLVDGASSLQEEYELILEKPWTMRNGEEIYSTRSKSEVIRMSLNQIVHHRAQLGVYLRLLNIPIPGSYGPSADEMSF